MPYICLFAHTYIQQNSSNIFSPIYGIEFEKLNGKEEKKREVEAKKKYKCEQFFFYFIFPNFSFGGGFYFPLNRQACVGSSVGVVAVMKQQVNTSYMKRTFNIMP